jgi:phage major head subunit gpT-like protein
VINLGESQACFDGQFFYDTDHLWGDSGSQSNDLTSNVVTTNDPTAAELKIAFHAALIAMLGFKNDQGKPLIRPTVRKTGESVINDLILAVPLNMLEAAQNAFDQVLSLEGGAATTNVLLAKPAIVGVPYMGATYTNGADTKFDLHYTGGRIKPFVFQAREPLQVQTKGPGDIETKDYKVMTEARYNVGYLAWWNSVRTTLT